MTAIITMGDKRVMKVIHGDDGRSSLLGQLLKTAREYIEHGFIELPDTFMHLTVDSCAGVAFVPREKPLPQNTHFADYCTRSTILYYDSERIKHKISSVEYAMVPYDQPINNEMNFITAVHLHNIYGRDTLDCQLWYGTVEDDWCEGETFRFTMRVEPLPDEKSVNDLLRDEIGKFLVAAHTEHEQYQLLLDIRNMKRWPMT